MKNFYKWNTLALPFVLLMGGCAPSITLHGKPVVNVYLTTHSRNLLNDQAVSVQFLGNTTLVIEDKNDRIIVDGFLSRPSRIPLLFGSISTETKTVDSILHQAGINKHNLKTQAIIPLHSHFDHILDAPYIANKLGACVIADETAKIITKSYEAVIACPPANPENQDHYLFGAFGVSVSDTIHLDNGFVGSILAPLGGIVKAESKVDFSQPQKANRYEEGRSLNIVIDHKESGVKLFVISGAFGADHNESIENFQTANAVFISTPLFDKSKSPEFYRLIARLLKKRTTPSIGVSKKVIIPMHWDDLSRKIPACTKSLEDTDHVESCIRDKLLVPAIVLRRAISDAKGLFDELNSQKTNLIWLTAYDQILLK